MTAYVPGDGVLLALTSPRIRAKVMPWRRIYDPYYRTVPPHVSIAYPSFVRAENWSTARDALARCLAAFPPFWVTLAELGAFEKPRAVLWLRPDDGGMLNRIHAALCEQFPHWVADGPLGYIPHVTLGFFDSLDALAQARAKIAVAWQPMRFRVRTLTYAALETDGVWHVRDEAPLGG